MLFLTDSLTLTAYSSMSYLNSLAASPLAGLSGFGSYSIDRMEVSIAQTS